MFCPRATYTTLARAQQGPWNVHVPVGFGNLLCPGPPSAAQVSSRARRVKWNFTLSCTVISCLSGWRGNQAASQRVRNDRQPAFRATGATLPACPRSFRQCRCDIGSHAELAQLQAPCTLLETQRSVPALNWVSDFRPRLGYWGRPVSP